MTLFAFLPILGAGIAATLLGWLWYSPALFGRYWMRMVNVTPEMAERGKRRMPFYALIALVASMLVAWVMWYVGILLGVYDTLGAIELGFWCWFGFTAPPMLGMVLWEHKPFRYYLIVAGYWLVAFILMALILVGASQFLSSTQPYDTSLDQQYSE